MRHASAEAPRIRVIVVDDQRLMREGLRRVLESDPALMVVGECADGAEVGHAVDHLRPDVVLMDMRMRSVDGDVACRLLSSRPDPPPVIAVTAYDSNDVVSSAVDAGVRGLVLKNSPGEELVSAIKAVAGGAAWIDPLIAHDVLQAYRVSRRPSAALEQLASLTRREEDVLRAASRGATNAEIGSELFIGEATVKTHLSHILAKLGLRHRLALVVYAFDHGLTQPQPR